MTRRRFPSRRPHATALTAVLALVAFSTALLPATSTLAKVSQEYDGRDGTLPWVEPPVGGDDDEPTAQRPRGEAYDAAVSDGGGEAAGGGMPSDPGGSWFRAVRRTVERVHAAVRVSLRFLR